MTNDELAVRRRRKPTERRLLEPEMIEILEKIARDDESPAAPRIAAIKTLLREANLAKQRKGAGGKFDALG